MSKVVRQKTRIEQGGDGEGAEYKRGKLPPLKTDWEMMKGGKSGGRKGG